MSFGRIHIFGGAGSGKTTLAREYSARFGVRHHEMDDLCDLEAASRTRRGAVERNQLLADSIASEEWVLDGIFWQPWVRPAIERSDKIVVLAVPERVRQVRVVKRHFQMLAKAAGVSEYRYFVPTLVEPLKHNRIYDRGPLQETLQTLAESNTR